MRKQLRGLPFTAFRNGIQGLFRQPLRARDSAKNKLKVSIDKLIADLEDKFNQPEETYSVISKLVDSYPEARKKIYDSDNPAFNVETLKDENGEETGFVRVFLGVYEQKQFKQQFPFPFFLPSENISTRLIEEEKSLGLSSTLIVDNRVIKLRDNYHE